MGANMHKFQIEAQKINHIYENNVCDLLFPILCL